MLRVAILTQYDVDQSTNGIGDYSRILRGFLAAAGIVAALCSRQDDGLWSLAYPGFPPLRDRQVRELATFDTLLIQYNPFMYGRWGFAPWLPTAIGKLRLSGAPPRIVVMVHEPFVPLDTVRTAIMGVWQRAQIIALLSFADIVLCSTQAWTHRIGGWRPRRPTYHLPVASNLPDRRSERLSTRHIIDPDGDALVLATFSTDHPSHLRYPVEDAVRAVVAAGLGNIVLLELGRREHVPADRGKGVTVVSPGRLVADQLACLLSTADIYLAPFADGVSTRRTTLMAALQHALPVVGTAGRLTDDSLMHATDSLLLVPVGQPHLFAAGVVELARNSAGRDRLGLAGRELYERNFDWPILVRRLIMLLEGG